MMIEDRVLAKAVAALCAQEFATAKDTGVFDTRCFVQNAELIIAALREYADPNRMSASRWFSDDDKPMIKTPKEWVEIYARKFSYKTG